MGERACCISARRERNSSIPDLAAAPTRRNRPVPSRTDFTAHAFSSCLGNWLRQADVEDGLKPGTTAADNAELREEAREDRRVAPHLHV
jgi:hypothetical protein